MAQTEGKRATTGGKPAGGKIALIVVLAVVVLLAAGYLILCAMAGSGTFLPNTTIAGVDVGGRTVEEATTLLEEQVPQRLAQLSATFTCNGNEYTVQGSEAQVQLTPAIEEAQAAQSGGFLARGGQYLTALTGGSSYNVQVSLTTTPQAVTQAIEECADPEAQTTWEVVDDQLVFHKGVTGRTIDTQVLTEELEARFTALLSGDSQDQTPIETQVTTAPLWTPTMRPSRPR